jgi:hypothetical protein
MYSNESKERCIILLKKVVKYASERLQLFSVVDWTFVKVCMVSFGMLIGMRCSRAKRFLSGIALLSFLASASYLLWRIFTPIEE